MAHRVPCLALSSPSNLEHTTRHARCRALSPLSVARVQRRASHRWWERGIARVTTHQSNTSYHASSPQLVHNPTHTLRETKRSNGDSLKLLQKKKIVLIGSNGEMQQLGAGHEPTCDMRHATCHCPHASSQLRPPHVLVLCWCPGPHLLVSGPSSPTHRALLQLGAARAPVTA